MADTGRVLCDVRVEPRIPRALPEERATANKRAFVHRLFTAIAPRYDWFNRLASLTLDQCWRRRAIVESGVGPGMRVLDVCTGTGDLALLCADRTREGGVVVGLDFNETMLQAASQKQQQTRQAIRWLQGDAQALPCQSGSVDRVFIGFSTRNLSDLPQGLREMLRVLKPGGQLIVLETGKPNNRLVSLGYLVFLFTIARLIGWLLTGRLWPFTYLARSVKGFVSPAEFVALLNACGSQARYLPLSCGLASLYLARKPGSV